MSTLNLLLSVLLPFEARSSEREVDHEPYTPVVLPFAQPRNLDYTLKRPSLVERMAVRRAGERRTIYNAL